MESIRSEEEEDKESGENKINQSDASFNWTINSERNQEQLNDHNRVMQNNVENNGLAQKHSKFG